MVVNLVEMTGVDDLVLQVKKGKYKSTTDVLAKSQLETMISRYLKWAYCLSSDCRDTRRRRHCCGSAENVTQVSSKANNPQYIPLKLIYVMAQLSYMRITTPCRSSMCVHSQCFDAMSWFSMMEQTTTYLCPVCEQTLNYEELIIDG